MKVMKSKKNETILVFNNDPNIRKNIIFLLKESESDTTIIEEASQSECILKTRNQKFTILILRSTSIMSKN